MASQDRTLQCIDCKTGFVFTAGEQEFFERKGFREIPKRCRPCRDERKSRRPHGGRAGAEGGDGDAERAGRGERPGRAVDGNRAQHGGNTRELFDAVCAGCGVATQIPFRPASGRPVYCRECYAHRQAQGSGHGGRF